MSSFSITQISQTTSAVAITGSVIPLTTIFTPPADCNQASGYEEAYSNDGTIGYNTDSAVQQSSCYPPRYRNYQWQKSGWYSPGVCPSAYEWVATSLDGPTTLAICCPPGFLTKGNMWSCTQIQTTQLPGQASVTVAFANPISVAWQSSDLDKFIPASAPILALAAQTGGSVSATSSSSSVSTTSTITHYPSSTSDSNSNNESSDLSTGAKAGIGVGVAVAALAIIAGMIYWFFRRYQLTQKPKKAEVSTSAEKRDIYGENMSSPMDARHPTELDGDGNVYEAANSSMPAEAPTKTIPHELEGDTVPELSQENSRATSKAVSDRS